MLSSRRTHCRGFTLVELLVVIAIIGILIALLLPAVQAAREAARRTQCKNNLKQMSLAFLTHESAHKTLPAGGWCWYWVGDPDAGFTRTQPGGWTYNILPFIEEAQLRQIGSGITNITLRKRALTSVMEFAPNVFYCPSRVRSRLTVIAAGYCNAWGTPDSGKGNKGDYAASGGTYLPPGQDFVWPPAASTPQAAINHSSFNWPTVFTNACDGVTCIAKAMPLREIVDGTAHTYLLGEKHIDPDYYENGYDGGDNQALFTGYDWDNIRWTVFPPSQDQPGRAAELSFGSTHPGGFQMAFGDGSIRLISYTIDLDAHRDLSTRAGGENVNQSAF
jgi:prepilin-type N-terminal cleavage/methylation domain-containing protein